ncbi:MAG: hypothetical protein M1816_005993 [Peltula sp. TS41687]|nr:MAG: hypothetical protein M1816_005993 [Peltula sp. TS41687]
MKNYCRRPVEQEDLTLLEVARDYNWIESRQLFKKRSPKTASKVVSVFPRYSADISNPQYPDFCRSKMLLHHPFRSFDDLIDGFSSESQDRWLQAYAYCQEHHLGQNSEDPLELHLPEKVDAESDFETMGDESDDQDMNRDIQEWELLAARNQHNDGLASTQDQRLGARSQDISHDWLANSDQYGIAELQDFWKVSKAQADENQHSTGVLDELPDPATLNENQKKVFDCNGQVPL